jgi:single-stranded DNA-binding protein
MNYVGGIVRILETPKLHSLTNNIYRTEFRAKLPQIRNKKSPTIVKLVFWGDFAYDVANYYQVNDYILIEGYLAYKKEESRNGPFKNLEITVFKVYPLFLNSEKKANILEKLK